MIKIRNNTDLIKWVSLKLGSPVHNIEIAPDQWELLIDEALEIFWRYHTGDGNFLQYGIIELKKGKTQYNLRDIGEFFPTDEHGAYIPNSIDLNNIPWKDASINIEQVLEVKGSGGGTGGINKMFSAMHAWWQGGGKDMIESAGMHTGDGRSSVLSVHQPGTYNNTSSPAGYDAVLPMTSYFLAMQNLATIEKLFRVEFECHWRSQAGILNIAPTPDTDMPAMLSYWAKENRIFVYNNPLFKRYLIASAKYQWGINLSKFSKSLVGGGEINANDLKSEGKEEMDQLLEDEIKGESHQPFFYIG